MGLGTLMDTNGSYDFPILGPRLRLNLFAGYNEFDITDSSVANFLGRGTFAGGTLRYNLHQHNDWFFDITGTMSYEESKISTFLSDFPEIGGIDTNIHMYLWGYGAEIYRTNDMSDTLFAFNQINSLDGSSPENFEAARTGADDNFNIYTTRARHSQYLDSNKIQRVSGTFTWITSDVRLVPAKMTTFGGMYTVRGYDESEIIADGGILTSLQYEYDLVRRSQVELFGTDTDEKTRKPFLRKLAPLAFFDYGLAKVEDPTEAEQADQELASVGGGFITELGNNFSGTVYYGYPLIPTDNTRSGKGRLNVGILLRW
jgi:hemolysin activation/secretion protein